MSPRQNKTLEDVKLHFFCYFMDKKMYVCQMWRADCQETVQDCAFNLSRFRFIDYSDRGVLIIHGLNSQWDISPLFSGNTSAMHTSRAATNILFHY